MLALDISSLWFPYDLQRSATRLVAVCVVLIADHRKHRRQMFPFKSEAIADKRTTNSLRSEEIEKVKHFPLV